jgi:hypothetical protein
MHLTDLIEETLKDSWAKLKSRLFFVAVRFLLLLRKFEGNLFLPRLGLSLKMENK